MLHLPWSRPHPAEPRRDEKITNEDIQADAQEQAGQEEQPEAPSEAMASMRMRCAPLTGARRVRAPIDLAGASEVIGPMSRMADATAILGAPGCVRSRAKNVVDLLLPRLLVGERLGARRDLVVDLLDLQRLGRVVVQLLLPLALQLREPRDRRGGRHVHRSSRGHVAMQRRVHDDRLVRRHTRSRPSPSRPRSVRPTRMRFAIVRVRRIIITSP